MEVEGDGRLKCKVKSLSITRKSQLYVKKLTRSILDIFLNAISKTPIYIKPRWFSFFFWLWTFSSHKPWTELILTVVFYIFIRRFVLEATGTWKFFQNFIPCSRTCEPSLLISVLLASWMLIGGILRPFPPQPGCKRRRLPSGGLCNAKLS